ncbi:MAG: GHKL domain-containing protein [Saprospiraceae bacterium]|nr:GHKL domain-containing protein [Saprospiraceae bacterium]
MVLSKFRTQALVNVSLLVLFVSLGIYMLLRQQSYFLGGILIFLAAVIVYRIFSLVNRTNRYLANFLMSIKYDDFETNFNKTASEVSEKELFGAFNLISGKFRDIRLEKEIQFQYFQTLVENVETGLVGFDQSGKTIFMNKALQQILRKSYFPNLDAVEKYDKSIYQLIKSMRAGDRKLIKKIIFDETKQLAIQKTQLKIKNGVYNIFSITNISEELQAQEITAWQKLIRILTHEIMNSVSPVISLAHSTNDLINSTQVLDAETRDEIRMAIKAIQKRSEGLLHFTETYRKLTKVPMPSLAKIDAQNMLNGVVLLMGTVIKDKGIELEYNLLDKPVELNADQDQLEQVLINLIKNAIEALQECMDKKITIQLESREGYILFRIRDNGPGVPPELREQIFIPFYTTKEEGSGIGLSLSRQIVYQHGGNLRANFPEEGGAEFIVTLPSQDYSD